jgi:hypothetical protein
MCCIIVYRAWLSMRCSLVGHACMYAFNNQGWIKVRLCHSEELPWFRRVPRLASRVHPSVPKHQYATTLNHLVNKPQEVAPTAHRRRQRQAPIPSNGSGSRIENPAAARLRLSSRIPNKMVSSSESILTPNTHLTTRLYRSDNDMYDHMNNSVYYFLYVPLTIHLKLWR